MEVRFKIIGEMFFISVVPAVFLIFFHLNASATTFYQPPFPETVASTQVIVRGRVEGQNADWGRGRDGARRIYTFIELDVDEVLKGSVAGRSIFLRELGGAKDGVGLQVPGAAHFSRGEDVVVFLGGKNPDGSYDLQGMMMGKYAIQRDSNGEEYLVGAGLRAASGFVQGEDHREDRREEADQGRDQRWTMEALRKLIIKQKKLKTEPPAEPGEPTDMAISPKLNPPRQFPPGTRQSTAEAPTAAESAADRQDRNAWKLKLILGVAFLAVFIITLLYFNKLRK